MFIEVKQAKYQKDYVVLITFSDGKTKLVDLKDSLSGIMFEPLRDMAYFRNFKTSFNTLEWPNGADFAPEYLYKIGVLQYDSPTAAAEGEPQR